MDRIEYGFVTVCNQNMDDIPRNINPEDVYLPPGYRVEVYAMGLNLPISMVFQGNDNILIAEAGYNNGNPRVLRLQGNEYQVIAEGFNVPITGIAVYEENIYVSHRGVITAIRPDGSKHDVLTGLPSSGDYQNNNVVFGQDRKMYFGLGTTTNSGVVGLDNTWVSQYPLAHDFPGNYIILKGQNFETVNIQVGAFETVNTGAFSPFGVSNLPNEIRKGINRPSGSILRANPDGTNLETVAWGFRNPAYIKFDEQDRLFVANHGYDVRGSRPIANAPDTFDQVLQGVWYGWPDYAGGEPVTSPRFAPEGRSQPEFLLLNHPNIPPIPFAIFPAETNILGFDFNYNQDFGPYGDVYIAEFGIAFQFGANVQTPYSGTGHRISKINMSTGAVSTFAINKSGFAEFITGEGGFGRPCDVIFGPDGALYVLDMGTNLRNDPDSYVTNTGVIWRIVRVE